MSILKLLKWIFGIMSGVLSVLLITYVAMKNDSWAIVADDGHIVVDKTMGICLIIIWAVIGGIYLLFDYLHRRAKKRNAQ